MKKLIVYLFVIALIVRLVFLAAFFHSGELIGDEVQYDTIAYNVAYNHSYSMILGIPTPLRPPGYPLFLAVIYTIFGHSYLAVKIIQSILSAITCLIIYFLTKEAIDDKTAKIAFVFMALYPVLIGYNSTILSETLYTLLLAVFMLFFVLWIKRSNITLAVNAGIFLGLATLTRPVTMLYPFLILPLIFYKKFISLKSWLVFFIMFLAVLLPWSARNYTLFGIIEPCATGPGLGLFISGNMASGMPSQEINDRYINLLNQYPETLVLPDGRSPKVVFQEILKKEGSELIRKNFKNYILIVIKRLPQYLITSNSSIFGIDKTASDYIKAGNYMPLAVKFILLAVHALLLGLGLIGMVIAVKKWPVSIVFIMIFIYFLGHITFDPCPRFNLPVMPYLFIFAAVALNLMYLKIKKVNSD